MKHHLTETMRWALTAALREAIEARGCKYGTEAFDAMCETSLTLCERNEGAAGVRPQTLMAALRIACVRLSQMQHDLEDSRIYASDLEDELTKLRDRKAVADEQMDSDCNKNSIVRGT